MIPADFDKRITFKEFEGSNFSEEPCLRTLLLRYYGDHVDAEKAEDYVNRYIAQMCEEMQE